MFDELNKNGDLPAVTIQVFEMVGQIKTLKHIAIGLGIATVIEFAIILATVVF